MLPASVAIFKELVFKKSNPIYTRRLRIIGALSLSFCAVVIVLAISSLTWGVPSKVSATQAGGWRQLARLVKEAETELASQTGQEPFILGVDKCYLAAQLGFYMKRPKGTVNWFAVGLPGLGYRYWTNLKALNGRPAIAVLPDVGRLSTQTLENYFYRIGDHRYLKILNKAKRERNVYLVSCYGYRSPDSGDVNH